MTYALTSVRRLREEQGLTQEELARRVGVSPPAVSKWERGLAFPSMGKVVKLAEVFGVTVNEVVSGKPVSA